MITTEQIKTLRNKTGLSVMQCKEALEASGGDIAKAESFLREKGIDIALKKSDRTLAAGVVSAYIHNTKKIGSLVELNCETDFVAKNDEFVNLGYSIAMHIAAMSPKDIPALLEQPFVKDAEKTIKTLIESGIQKFGERIEVRRFTQYSILDGE